MLAKSTDQAWSSIKSPFDFAMRLIQSLPLDLFIATSSTGTSKPGCIMMALRTEALFEFWQDTNDGRAVTFFQTGSIYPMTATDPDIDPPDEPGNTIDVPGEFPGLEPPVGGFFAEATN